MDMLWHLLRSKGNLVGHRDYEPPTLHVNIHLNKLTHAKQTFSELWSMWILYRDEQKMNKHPPTGHHWPTLQLCWSTSKSSCHRDLKQMHYCRGSLGGHLSTAHTVEQRDFIAGHIRINAFVGKYMKLLFSYCTFFFFLSVCLAFFLSPHEILIYYCFHPSSSSLPRHTLLCSLPSLF